MKKACLENSQISFRIREAKTNGKKVLYWRLTKSQSQFIKERLNLNISPEIFRIRTKKIKGEYRKFPPIIKVVSDNNKANKNTFSMPLSNKEKHELYNFGVKFWPEKYKIIL